MRAVSAGATSSFAWLDDDTVMAWGGCVFPSSVDPSPHRMRPEPFDALRGTRAIVGNGSRHLALAADGAVLAWGVSAG